MATATRKRKKIVVKGRFAVGASLPWAGATFAARQAIAYRETVGHKHVNRFTKEEWNHAA